MDDMTLKNNLSSYINILLFIIYNFFFCFVSFIIIYTYFMEVKA